MNSGISSIEKYIPLCRNSLVLRCTWHPGSTLDHGNQHIGAQQPESPSSSISLSERFVIGAEFASAKNTPIVMTEMKKRISSGLTDDWILKYLVDCFNVFLLCLVGFDLTRNTWPIYISPGRRGVLSTWGRTNDDKYLNGKVAFYWSRLYDRAGDRTKGAVIWSYWLI